MYELSVKIDEDQAKKEPSTTQAVGDQTGDQQMHEIKIPTVETLYGDQYTAVVDNQAAVDLPKEQFGDPSTQ